MSITCPVCNGSCSVEKVPIIAAWSEHGDREQEPCLRCDGTGSVTAMTDAEAIDAVRNGRRAVTSTTLHTEAKPEGCPGWNHSWRTVACDYTTDVVECSRCGKQEIMSCNFDEEMS